MSLLTHRPAVWLCLWHPDKDCRTVAHPKSHSTHSPLAVTSTLELLRSPWATGGLCASARKSAKIWFKGLTGAKRLKNCVAYGWWSSELKWQIFTKELNRNHQITQYELPDKTHRHTETHRPCLWRSEWRYASPCDKERHSFSDVAQSTDFSRKNVRREPWNQEIKAGIYVQK